jgi:transcriptional regulator with XRE-family HTH domain
VTQEKLQKSGQTPTAKLKKLNGLVEAVCGIYTRVARRLGVHRSYVSRVARGERRSGPVEDALVAEYDRVENG